MITVNSDGKIMVRRCLVTLRPFRIFVVGIGFFTLCFLMTSLGGQFSAKRLGDSPFTIRTEVMGALESRGVLRKMSDMLEMMVKRMDVLARLENSTDFRKGEEAHFPMDRYHPAVGLMERIQAIAQNVSDIAMKVDQILRNSLLNGKPIEGRHDQCEVPRDPKYPDCSGKVEWMRARWTSDPCYAFFGVDGTECSFLIYLSEVEWFCPVLPWRNQTVTPPSTMPPPRAQATFQRDLSSLLELIGSGKESLIFMKKRIRHLATQWLRASHKLELKLEGKQRNQKQILIHIGFLTEESGDVFSPRVLKGGPLGEMVQWADILAVLFILGHSLKITISLKELQSNLGVPPGRGNCPLTVPLPFDLIYTDYHGLQQMKQHMGLSFKKYRCRVRVIDTFGTEPAYNHEEYATLHGYRTNWGYWNLNPKQFMTMFPHTPDNSFMGFVSEELNETEKQFIKSNKANNVAVVYGKEASIWKGKEKFLAILNKYMEIHGTVYYETQRPPEVPAFVKNHGLLPQHEFQQLLRKAKLFIGFGFPYEGPAPLEAIANGCVFLQARFNPPHSSLNHEFFRGKPTSREVSSQHPYAEDFIGKPHVWTVDYNNSEEFEAAVKAIMRTKVDPYLPYEYTSEGMLERIHAYIQYQDFCATAALPDKSNDHTMQNSESLFSLQSNSTFLVWPHNFSSSPPAWPPVNSLQVWISDAGQACTSTCQQHDLVCEPEFFKFINKKEVFQQLNIACDSTESEMNHLYPAVAENVQECYLQKEPLLFSCAGCNAKYQRLCPCRNYQKGQVALCGDCL
ncbi:alpha-1,6-mannosylglycoprotein 6-beta-N-acetylglucosaminyltransferase B isoform X1 [Rhineura floridana]|uniref:alpha-1,6-mannosylglycoprotein 6-beta-N-acetylglucosaminyltransferase B isoform X1 n=1 Tax=Rhineura floridana TaxID=261503 RepID=UPI002AC810A1|nr:alpha-1,6-mannosylglycoprotein 6-beta-N-acetylglucosaminyltransferase B isoform X1 [Rhineura floridana]